MRINPQSMTGMTQQPQATSLIMKPGAGQAPAPQAPQKKLLASKKKGRRTSDSSDSSTESLIREIIENKPKKKEICEFFESRIEKLQSS
jgi:hypothetical protein